MITKTIRDIGRELPKVAAKLIGTLGDLANKKNMDLGLIEMKEEQLELIGDKAALFHLNQFGEIDECVEETKRLIQRKIDGVNPSRKEWAENTNAYANINTNPDAYAFNYAKAYAKVKAYHNAYTYHNAYAFDYAQAYAQAKADTNSNAYALAFNYAFEFAYANTYSRETAEYIVKLLGDDLVSIPDINKQVLGKIDQEGNELFMGSWHKYGLCGTTHCRAGWEIVLHPLGSLLEKYLGPWMVATVIHLKSTGEFVDYFADKEVVMKELREAKND